MKSRLLFLLPIIFIIACQTYSFKNAFGEVMALDKKYNTSLYTEALDVENVFSDYRIYYFDWGRTIIKPEYVDSYISDLIALKDKIERINPNEKQGILYFIDARIHMLEAEKLYQLGLSIEDKGNARKGFACKNMQYVIALSDYYNSSTIIGQNATALIDKMLTHYPVTREFLAGDKRPKFYDSPFWPIRKFAINNKYIVEELCVQK